MHFPLLLAGGASQRFGGDKLAATIAGESVLEHSLSRVAEAFASPGVLVSSKANLAQHKPLLPAHWQHCVGGKKRSSSVACSLEVLQKVSPPNDSDWIWIFDAARPAIHRKDIEAMHEILDTKPHLQGLIAASKSSDSLVEIGKEGQPRSTLQREKFALTSTPQVFRAGALFAAYDRLADKEESPAAPTDDLEAVLRAGTQADDLDVHILEHPNPKITHPHDLALVRAIMEKTAALTSLRSGIGIDTHKLAGGAGITLGCVAIPCEFSVVAHSDGDVLAHAIMDALLGAAALGDIGKYFPADDINHNRSGADMLDEIVQVLAQSGYAPSQLDSVVICRRPRLEPHKDAMRTQIARHLKLPQSAVSVKATTTDGVGAEGEGSAITAHAVATIGPAGAV